MKIAILLAGPYRGNPTNIANHIKFIGNHDTYVSCFEHYKEDWINSGWPIKKIFTTPNINFKETNWTTESEFVFKDKSTLICTVSGDGNAPLTYRKIR